MSTPTGIVPFRLYHSLLLARLERSKQSICLLETLIYPRPAWVRALASFLALEEGHTWTYLLSQSRRDGQVEQGFVQAFQPAEGSKAYLLSIAPRLDGDEGRSLWHRLLGHLMSVAAERGFCSLYVSAEEASPELEAWTEIGFSVYAREEILRLSPDACPQTTAWPDVRPEHEGDRWAIGQLYRSVTPHLVQQAELAGRPVETASSYHPPIFNHGEGFVLSNGADVVGYGHLIFGQRGHWLTLMVDPGVGEQRIGRLIDYALALLDYYPLYPVYCAIRHYQEGLLGPLQARNFQPFSTQCCLVKHTAVRVTESTRVVVSGWENRVQAPTTTISPSETIKGVYER